MTYDEAAQYASGLISNGPFTWPEVRLLVKYGFRPLLGPNLETAIAYRGSCIPENYLIIVHLMHSYQLLPFKGNIVYPKKAGAKKRLAILEARLKQLTADDPPEGFKSEITWRRYGK